MSYAATPAEPAMAVIVLILSILDKLLALLLRYGD
jgi:hypothetical protein